MACSSFLMVIFFIKGKFGINVNKNKNDGGIAIIKLYEIADALSVSPTVFTCFKKKAITSYNGTPSKPGKYQPLLLRITNATGGLVSMIRSSFVNVVF